MHPVLHTQDQEWSDAPAPEWEPQIDRDGDGTAVTLPDYPALEPPDPWPSPVKPTEKEREKDK